jgi:hypothetical protein
MVSVITSLEFFITSKLLGLIIAQPIGEPVVKPPPIHLFFQLVGILLHAVACEAMAPDLTIPKLGILNN